MSIIDKKYKHVGGVFIEAMSVCFLDKKQEELQKHCIEEMEFAEN